MIDHAAAMLLALALDAAIGWPDTLYRRIGHPVAWLGRLIGAGDRTLNRETDTFARRRALGIALALGVIALAVMVGWLMPRNWIVAGVLAWPLLAARSLYTHVAAVAQPLVRDDLAGARRAVSMIVGRDPDRLDRAGVARAAAESLAENTSDGVIAPLFWGVLFGLPGIAGYKAVNTLDSMIGYRSARHRAFGWAGARIDDLANLVPARLTGLLYALAGGQPARAIAVMLRDARHHRSPNAGWPESAFAAALNIRLSGPRVYPEGMSDDAWLNGTAPDPQAADLLKGLVLFRRTVLLGAVIMAAITAWGIRI